ncbi:MAG: hypothetical protein PHQ62_02565 [Clostridia bacterium]|nr:hypothetical protein [Clostridia bacterium]
MAVFFIIKSRYAYEMRMVRKLLQLNGWLNRNQFIDSNNLLEFNNLMKKTPKLLRYHWHQYMLYRENAPSFYMSPYNCIDKPLKTSSFKANILSLISISNALALIVLMFGLTGLGTAELTFTFISKVLATPLVIILLNTIFVLVLRARENVNLSAFYQYFYYFNRFMDKAVATMPEYVDFEVLFTKSEIRKGIPVLNEYLEKRARQEQEELEKARLNAVEHENFDFSNVGPDGTLVLERAMKETETYINVRQRLLSEIQQLESEIESIKRNYENTQKDYQKKMQASKENIDRLRKQQEETTNRIENNYIKKQQSDEIKKQEQLEKDHDGATIRFNQEMESLTTEIVTRRADLEEKRQYVEQAMKAEYQTFSTKMYKSVVALTEERNQEEKDTLLAMKDEISEQLEEAHLKISEKEKENEDLKAILEKHNIVVGEHGGFFSKKLQAETKRVRRGKKKKGEEYDDDGYILEPTTETQDKIIPETKNAKFEQKEIVYDENGGYFDDKGNYFYKNGAYYDAEGIYHDEFGGWYELDGKTYHPPKETIVKAKEPVVEIPKIEEPIEQAKQEQFIDESKFVETNVDQSKTATTPQEQQLDENGAYYDDKGNYVYPNKGYYDPDGNFHDLKGGWYEADGTTYHAPQQETEVTILETPTKRKAGRPRKVVSEQDAPKEKKQRGRPRKTEESGSVEKKTSTGKRGRPKKIKVETEEKATKGKRGRPAKTTKVETEEKTATIKRGRGRPKKEVIDEIQILNEKIENENRNLEEHQKQLKNQLNEALSQLNENDNNENE